MTDTEILHDAVNFFERAARFHSNPTPAEECRTRAAAIRRVIARVAELEAEAAARDEAVRYVLDEHQKAHDAPWCRVCGPQGGRFPCGTYAVLTDAKKKEQS